MLSIEYTKFLLHFGLVTTCDKTTVCFGRNVCIFGSEAVYVRSRSSVRSLLKTHCFGVENPLLR